MIAKRNTRAGSEPPAGPDAGVLTPEIAWVFCHPRMQGGAPSAKPLTKTDEKGAPSRAAIALLRQSLANPKPLQQAVTSMLLSAAKAKADLATEAAKARGRLEVETHKAKMRMEVKAEALRLEAQQKRAEKEADKEDEEVAAERRSIEELKAIARRFRE